MSKQSPIGHAKCPYCGKKVPVTHAENYWFHVPAKGYSWYATKGQFRTYCTGSGESITEVQLRYIRRQQGAMYDS